MTASTRERAPRCPQDIIKRAKAGNLAAAASMTFWKQMAPLLWRSGRLTALDILSFELLALAYGNVKALEAQLAEEGETITEEGEYGPVVKRHPAAMARNQARTTFMALQAQFGLTPKARGMIKGTDPENHDGEDDLT